MRQKRETKHLISRGQRHCFSLAKGGKKHTRISAGRLVRVAASAGEQTASTVTEDTRKGGLNCTQRTERLPVEVGKDKFIKKGQQHHVIFLDRKPLCLVIQPISPVVGTARKRNGKWSTTAEPTGSGRRRNNQIRGETQTTPLFEEKHCWQVKAHNCHVQQATIEQRRININRAALHFIAQSQQGIDEVPCCAGPKSRREQTAARHAILFRTVGTPNCTVETSESCKAVREPTARGKSSADAASRGEKARTVKMCEKWKSGKSCEVA
ncbi:uncharacterized protein LOC131687488 [Topomyia yanbarensis]|uniref:uncharacterized protein LOC131687488 n=1 Tax=Topomyia yanbarensis TaxID=2498891 RepID=UPI00273BA0D2|nr:uncharacterized protein LOC131687488 [Topomyia yanbarensis]